MGNIPRKRFDISIHALREEGDAVNPHSCTVFSISIHALREEGDSALLPACWAWLYFNPRPPRGGRPGEIIRGALYKRFQSTPSARRATCTETVRTAER